MINVLKLTNLSGEEDLEHEYEHDALKGLLASEN